MAVTTKPLLERLCPLVDLQLHQIALKRFDYHTTASFPYNLLITVLEGCNGGRDYFQNCRDGSKIMLKTDHAYLLPCHMPIHFERTPDYEVVTMRFNLTFFYGIDIFDGVGKIFELHKPDFVQQLKQMVYEDEKDAIKSVVTLKSEVMNLCLACWPEGLDGISPSMWKYEKAFRYVREHCDARLMVADLAGLYNQRQDVFSRSFSRDIGMSPKQHITDSLLKKISVYLLTTQLNINQIAYELNFSSEYYMSRFFKKGTGHSPKFYRDNFSTH